jgi:hypothetical protein
MSSGGDSALVSGLPRLVLLLRDWCQFVGSQTRLFAGCVSTTFQPSLLPESSAKPACCLKVQPSLLPEVHPKVHYRASHPEMLELVSREVASLRNGVSTKTLNY